jgi:hypothetical protein
MPTLDQYAVGAPYPQSNCPEGSVLVPADNYADVGDAGYCLPRCTTDADCRLGYACWYYEERGGVRSTTGFCDRFDCHDARFATLPNNRCPPEYHCGTLVYNGQSFGGCVRDPPSSDGGVDGGDAAGDAAADGITASDSATGDDAGAGTVDGGGTDASAD